MSVRPPIGSWIPYMEAIEDGDWNNKTSLGKLWFKCTRDVDVVGLGGRLQLSTSDHQKDKLPAFAGIADFFATSTGDVSLVGLWKSNILTEILWEVDIRWIDSRQKRKIPG